ncbi:unnamed protein product [Closterium sp. Naga37s-1]|nr:unnamed protein product [Closterium sp. Naga37s-1]
MGLPEVQERIDQLYGDRNAKNFREGLGKGLVSVGKGVFAGVGGLIVAPVAGLVQQGGVGLIKGTFLGVAGAVVLPTVGIVQGVRQLGEGIKNTPDAVREMMKKDKCEEEAEKAEVVEDAEADKVNEETYSHTREAVEKVALEDEAAKSAAKPAEPSEAAAAAPAEKREKREVKEEELYMVLEVPTDATSAEIKKAYFKTLGQHSSLLDPSFPSPPFHALYPLCRSHVDLRPQLARTCHPDKVPDDEAAKAKFQAIGEAYQVLMDPESREKYDRFGRVALDGTFMDPGYFFTMSFGADKFKPLVGELTIAHTAAGNLTVEEVKRWQVKREKELAAILVKRLEPWMSDDEEGFVRDAVKQVDELKGKAFGVAFLQCIGYTYYTRAQVLLGMTVMLGIPNFVNAAKESNHAMKTRHNAIGAAFKLVDMQVTVDPSKAPSEQHSLPLRASRHITSLYPPVPPPRLRTCRLADMQVTVDPTKPPSEQPNMAEFLNSVWMISVLDIESTLRHVVELVVKDKTASKEDRKKRASGIMRLGKIFQEA